MPVLAVDIGGRNVRAAVLSSPEGWDPTAVETMPTHPAPGEPLETPALIQFLEYVISKKAGSHAVRALGFSIAGVTDPRKGFIHRALNIGWSKLALGPLMADHFGVPVSIDSDTFCGGLAESRVGAGKNEETFLYLAIGTGIGHCLVLDRRIWRGVHHAANIFGHLKIAPEGEPCYCGGEACVCQYASGEGLIRVAREHAPEPERIRSGKDVVEAAGRGAGWARKSLEFSEDMLSVSLSHAYTLLDLECVVLGGGAVSDSWPDLTRLTASIEKRVFPEVRPIHLERSQLGPHGNIVGAAINAFKLLAE